MRGWPGIRRSVGLLGCLFLVPACAGESSAPTTASGAAMEVTSSAFNPGMRIPTRHTCDGDDVSPALAITGLPAGTAALAVVVTDLDAPGGAWYHWVVFDIDPTAVIPEGATGIGIEGTTSWGSGGYRGPCPPGGSHRYVFTVAALDARLGLPAGAPVDTVLAAVSRHRLDEAALLGRYGR